MRTYSLAVACALVCLAAVPASQAQTVGITNPEVSTPTTMYFHLINIQDFPINTQLPNDDWTEEVTYGSGTQTLTCVSKQLDGTGQENLGGIENPYHVNRGYSSPSYVEYDFIESGVPRTHPERGISYDAVVDRNAPFTLYWYLKTASQVPTAGQATDNNAPIIVPNVVVEATIRAGDQISIDDKAYDRGELIGHGKTIPVTLTGIPDQEVQDSPATPGGKAHVTYVGNDQVGKVYQFALPMDFEADKVTRANGYNIRIDTYVQLNEGTCDDAIEKGNLMPNNVNVYTGSINGGDDKVGRPRMELAIMNPIRLEYLHPQFVGDDLVVHTSMNSAWGNYDVHESTINVRIEGPSAATSLVRAAIVQRVHEHYHHQEAVDVTYVWTYKQDRAINGLYTVYVDFENDQQNAKAFGVAQFEIGKGIVIGCGGIQESAQKLTDDCAQDVQPDGGGAVKESPGIELVGVLGILAVALALARRNKA